MANHTTIPENRYQSFTISLPFSMIKKFDCLDLGHGARSRIVRQAIAEYFDNHGIDGDRNPATNNQDNAKK